MAKKGFGSKFTIATNEVGELLNISGPSYSKEVIDATHMGSDDEFREKLGGLRDAGEITFEIQLDLESADAVKHVKLLESLEDDDEPVTCIAQLGESVTLTCDGIVTAFEPDAPLDDKLTASVTVAVSGKPTLANVTT